MNSMLSSRRMVLGILGTLCLTFLGWYTKDVSAVSFAIASISLGVSAANAVQGKATTVAAKVKAK